MISSTGLYTHIRSNNLKSVGLFCTFALALMLLWAIVFQIYYYVFSALGWLSLDLRIEVRESGVIFATISRLHYPMILAVLWTVAGFLFHALIVRSATGAMSIKRSEAPELYRIVENLVITAGMPMPRLEVMETNALNAYAAGLSPASASVAVTRGLLNTLEKDELEAVLAHEITHIRNYDTRLKVIAAVLSGGMCMLAERIWRHVCRMKVPLHNLFRQERLFDPVDLVRGAGTTEPQSGKAPYRVALLLVLGLTMPFLLIPGLIAYAIYRKLNKNMHQPATQPADGRLSVLPPTKLLYFPFLWPVWFALLVANVFLIAAYFISAVAQSAISRSREFLADAGAIELTKNPRALVSALAKIANRDALDDLDPAISAMMISAPAAGWLATHPTIEERIAALQSFAGAPLTTSYQRRNGAKVIAVSKPEFGKPAEITPGATFGRRRGKIDGGSQPRSN